MARWRNDIEAERELIEADLGCLGNARATLHLVSERIHAAARSGQGTILTPALDDLQRVEHLITQVQGRIGGRCPAGSPPASTRAPGIGKQ